MHTDEGGIAAVWTAVILLFLIGATALALDTSEFFQQARSQQRAVDLACLAGAAELPSDPALAVEKAADFARPNQRGLNMITPGTPTNLIGNVSTWITGDFVLEVETPAVYNGVSSASIMRVSLRQEAPTRFGKVLGADSAGIQQEAYCGAFTALGAGIIPIGVPGGFGGGIMKFDDSQCNDPSTSSGSGICNYLIIPRNEPAVAGMGVDTLTMLNMATGSDWPLAVLPGQDVRCDAVPGTADQPCNKILSRAGNVDVYGGLLSGLAVNIPGLGGSDYLGRLAYSDTGKAAPVNQHTPPSGGWSAVHLKNASPFGTITYNSNLVSTVNTIHSCSPASGIDYFDPAYDRPGLPAGGINPSPGDYCDDGEIDDQSTYPGTPPFAYEKPPEFTLSQVDCRDLRLAVVPYGEWESKTGGPSNETIFRIDGFMSVYILDPIVEDDTGNGTRSGTTSSGDTRMVYWEHHGSGTVTSNWWNDIDQNDTNIKQMSAFKVSLDTDGDGVPDANVTGGCPLQPLTPGLEDVLPSTIRLVEGP